MIVETLSGLAWHIEDAARKLSCRARLPGARVFDLAAESLRQARARGASAEERLYLALPASWLVNSPAVSPVLRRWALPPDCDVWLAFLDALEPAGQLRRQEETVKASIRSLGAEPYAVEAISKVAALLAPDVVPLMPPPARAFVLGEAAGADEEAFFAMASWLVREARANAPELEALSAGHSEVRLSGAQVLDWLLVVRLGGVQALPERGIPGAAEDERVKPRQSAPPSATAKIELPVQRPQSIPLSTGNAGAP